MSGHEGASFCLHISPSALASRTQSGGTTSGPARLVREDQKVVSRKRAPCGSGRPGRDTEGWPSHLNHTRICIIW